VSGRADVRSRTLSFIHISDLHLDGSADPYDVNRVLRPFLRRCAEWRDAGRPADLVFFTGDLGARGAPQDYRSAGVFLDELLAVTGLEPDALWVVPGNHDVDRSRGRLLLRTIDTAPDADEHFFAAPDQREPFLAKFHAYQSFAAGYLGSRAFAPGDVVHAPTTVDVRGIRLGIACFNSAWFAQADDDQGKLWLGVRLVEERSLELRRTGADVSVALLHHPTSYLHEREAAGAWLQQQFDFVLRGHLHMAEAAQRSTLSTSVVEVAAGALYQGSYQPCRAFFGRLDADEATLELEPYWFVDSPAATSWVLDTTVFPEAASSGYTGRFPVPSAVLATAIDDGPGIGRVSVESVNLPVTSWRDVVAPDWLATVVAWFAGRYPLDPAGAMQAVVEHCGDILRASRDQRNFGASVRNLAAALAAVLPEDDGGDSHQAVHHRLLLDLLASGIDEPVSHLFMLPTVGLSALVSNAAYVTLLGATRSLAAGEYEAAEDAARAVGEGCCVACFVIGQALRKQERNREAQVLLEEVRRLLARIKAEGTRRCNASPTLECQCNPVLLEAELERALGVVARRLGQPDVARQHFEAATTVVRSALGHGPSRAEHGAAVAAETVTGPGTLAVDFDVDPWRVVADVSFSYGYLCFEDDDYARAGELFDVAIDALERSAVDWDSPYTRRGLVYLLQGETEQAIRTLSRAREICRRTPASVNREAILSLALCSLGLAVAAEHVDASVMVNPLADLMLALEALPSLGMSALHCHLDDARSLEGLLTPRTRPLWSEFTDSIERRLAR
jgi:tetratricopeptide (TPR) repeat protein